MTTEEKKEIIKLYDNGIGYKKIASIVGVSIGSIRNVYLEILQAHQLN